MRISLLLHREPFREILKNTLNDFFQKRFGRPYRVECLQKLARLPRESDDEQGWMCNAYLNAIFVPTVHLPALAPVLNEFSFSTRWWRRPFQRLYVDLFARARTRKWLAKPFLKISPPLERAENILIIGGNHHIRLLDYNENVSFVIQKDGFDRSSVIEEIRLRRENGYLPAPRVRDMAADGSFYTEELILGTPINRIGNVTKRRDTVHEVIRSLLALYERTGEEVQSSFYVNLVCKRINARIGEMKLFGADTLARIKRGCVDLVAALSHMNMSTTGRIRVVQTHGDFQPANILVGERRAFLIDWEYTARRQQFYDCLVYSLNSRHPSGLAERLKQFVQGKAVEVEPLLGACTLFSSKNTKAVIRGR